MTYVNIFLREQLVAKKESLNHSFKNALVLSFIFDVFIIIMFTHEKIEDIIRGVFLILVPSNLALLSIYMIVLVLHPRFKKASLNELYSSDELRKDYKFDFDYEGGKDFESQLPLIKGSYEVFFTKTQGGIVLFFSSLSLLFGVVGYITSFFYDSSNSFIFPIVVTTFLFLVIFGMIFCMREIYNLIDEI